MTSALRALYLRQGQPALDAAPSELYWYARSIELAADRLGIILDRAPSLAGVVDDHSRNWPEYLCQLYVDHDLRRQHPHPPDHSVADFVDHMSDSEQDELRRYAADKGIVGLMTPADRAKCISALMDQDDTEMCHEYIDRTILNYWVSGDYAEAHALLPLLRRPPLAMIADASLYLDSRRTTLRHRYSRQAFPDMTEYYLFNPDGFDSRDCSVRRNRIQIGGAGILPILLHPYPTRAGAAYWRQLATLLPREILEMALAKTEMAQADLLPLIHVDPPTDRVDLPDQDWATSANLPVNVSAADRVAVALTEGASVERPAGLADAAWQAALNTGALRALRAGARIPADLGNTNWPFIVDRELVHFNRSTYYFNLQQATAQAANIRTGLQKAGRTEAEIERTLLDAVHPVRLADYAPLEALCRDELFDYPPVNEALKLTHGRKGLCPLQVTAHLDALCREGLPVVSIGSGSGALEAALERWYGIKIICVDPDPEDWAQRRGISVVRAPDYAICADLVAARPELVGACALLLNWCYPEGWSFPALPPYDLEAVQALAPRRLVSITEASGGAGSSAYLRWQAEQTEYAKQTVQASHTSADERIGAMCYELSTLSR